MFRNGMMAWSHNMNYQTGNIFNAKKIETGKVIETYGKTWRPNKMKNRTASENEIETHSGNKVERPRKRNISLGSCNIDSRIRKETRHGGSDDQSEMVDGLKNDSVVTHKN
ncbi:UNVERIFIED_CONTAM: hypothetical protein K2H54_035693 [Gekko kuhli]